MSKEYEHLFKFVLAGDSGVGKTSILFRITDDTFTETHITIGIEFKIKTVYIEGKPIKLQIWDTAGEKRFRVHNSHYRGCHGVIIVYDVTDQRSFENVPSWIEDIRRYANENVIKIIIGNKNDLVSQKVVDPFLAQEFADSLDIPFKEISAKQSINIEEAFISLVKLCINRIEETSLKKTQSPEKNNFLKTNNNT
ncbi:Rab GTPase [Dictyostelium discoideum AX4]|uniref:Rab GTPase n=1 Tax=Dictyostelium discoideum AX4 TaxID=352472 RepID=UPI00004E5185|nr:Rab GTPase [Dictyostelium discoideum AX4]EAL70401.1 Rab GTPase [Dictyostelium discoideum AX4]|eukprot:XP_644326.1 Rab GTPase [Dictyostelium discoideum AX4]